MYELLYICYYDARDVWVRISIVPLLVQLTPPRRESPESSQLATHLLVNQEDDRGVCHEFLTEFISRFAEDDSAKEAMTDAIWSLSRELAKMSMNDDYKPYVLVSLLILRRSASSILTKI